MKGAARQPAASQSGRIPRTLTTARRHIKPMQDAVPVALAAAAFLLAAVAPVSPQEQVSPAQLQSLENALAKSEQDRKQMQARREALLQEHAALSGRLVAAANQLREAEIVADATAHRVKNLQAEKAAIALDLASRQDVLSEVLAGLLRLEQNPPPALVVSPRDVLAALRSAMLFGTLAPELRQAAADLQSKLADLGATESRLKMQIAIQERVLADLAQSRAALARLTDEKRALAGSLDIDIEAEEARSRELAEKARTLRELLERIAAEEARKAEKEARRLALAARRSALAALPKTDFSAQRGKLGYPAVGRIIKRFGEDTGLGRPIDGIVIATAPRAAVTSPATGLVEFAGPFRTYGEMVIVNPGTGYLVLLAGLGRVSVSPGQPVSAGEPVATMGESAATMALAKDLTLTTTPMLYVEFRKNGEPVDPTPWWAGLPQPTAAQPLNENQGAMR
jgi:septal ring factor EnvC (AmiA/AmiB activator)